MIYGNTTCSNNSKIYEVHLVLFVYCQVANVILFLIFYFIYHLPPPLPHLMSHFSILCYGLVTVAFVHSLIYYTCQRSVLFCFAVSGGSGGFLNAGLQMGLLCCEGHLMHDQAEYKTLLSFKENR